MSSGHIPAEEAAELFWGASMTESITVRNAKTIQNMLAELRRSLKHNEDELEYREWCDGIIMGAIASLGLITGDFKNPPR